MEVSDSDDNSINKSDNKRGSKTSPNAKDAKTPATAKGTKTSVKNAKTPAMASITKKIAKRPAVISKAAQARAQASKDPNPLSYLPLSAFEPERMDLCESVGNGNPKQSSTTTPDVIEGAIAPASTQEPNVGAVGPASTQEPNAGGKDFNPPMALWR